MAGRDLGELADKDTSAWLMYEETEMEKQKEEGSSCHLTGTCSASKMRKLTGRKFSGLSGLFWTFMPDSPCHAHPLSQAGFCVSTLDKRP